MLTNYNFEISQSDLAKIVAKASSISELINKQLLDGETTSLNQQNESDKSLNRWCQIVAKGDWKKFHKRLQWDGLDINSAHTLIKSQVITEQQNLPIWAETLKETIACAAEFHHQAKIFVNSENSLPFEDLLLPVVSIGRQKLLKYFDSQALYPHCLPLEVITEAAYLKLERGLLSSLVKLSERTLEAEFNDFRPLDYYHLNTQVPPENKYYTAFVQSLLQDGMLTFFHKYPVLGKLIAIKIDLWVEATAEFLQRLQADLTEIKQVFLPQQKLGKIIDIQANLSDPHAGSRSCAILEFESGLKLVYKPKNSGIDVAYQHILDWCNQQDIPLKFKLIKVINRQSYGWVEYVEQLPIDDEATAQRFYQRSGMLLCLLYILGATDCHFENLIAHGEHLVLIDIETLMQHEATMANSPYQQQLMLLNRYQFSQQFSNTVLSTGLLPHWQFNKDKSIAYDISALGSIESLSSLHHVWEWQYVNTDNMQRVLVNSTNLQHKNTPILDSKPLSPNNYIDNLVTGFIQMYRFLVAHREAILTSHAWDFLQSQQVRFVFRNTKIYDVILQKSLAPEFLDSGVNWSIELDILTRAFLVNESQPNTWEILHSELMAMEQLDIPYFSANSDSDALNIGLGKNIVSFFKAPSYNQVISRLQNLNEQDLARQVEIIKSSFYAKVALPTFNRQQGLETAHHPLKASQILADAETLAEEIRFHAIKNASGSVYWIGFDYITKAHRFQLQPLNESLYDGNCGIALFLAALDYVTNNHTYRDLVLRALKSLRQVLQISDTQLTKKLAQIIGIGGGTGLGGIVYALVKISHFLEEPALLEDAVKAANLISLEVIAADKKLDAGTILGLLALYDQTANSEVLDKAIICGQHLLKFDSSYGENQLIGFLDNAASISYALSRLYAVTQDSVYQDVAGVEVGKVKPHEECNFVADLPKHVFNPSFRCGTSGIGYELLRLADPEVLPSVLLWE